MGALFFVPAGLGMGLVGGRTKKAAGKAPRFLLELGGVPFNPPPSFTVRHPVHGGYPLEFCKITTQSQFQK